MTNVVAVKIGGGGSLETTARQEAKRRDGPWKTDVTRAEKAPKVRAKAKTAASSLEVVTEI